MSSGIELSKEKINVLVAYTSEHRYIGYEGDLPWKRDFKGDMRYVTKLIRLCPNTALVVGKATYETIRRIRDVQILVVTSSEIAEDNARSFKTLSEAVDFARNSGMYVIAFGGSRIYEDAIKGYDCKLFCTVVEENNLKGDRAFPEVDAKLENVSSKVDQFLADRKVEKTWELKDNCFYENGYEYRFYIGYTVQ